MAPRELLAEVDRRVLALVLALVGIGILVLASVARNEPELARYPLRQVVWAGLAGVAFLAGLLPSYLRFRRHAWAIWVVAVGLLVAVRFAGTTANHARRWLPIAGGFGIQPSEFLKVALVVLLARILAHMPEEKQLPRILLSFGATLVPMALIVKQPDLGTALLLPPVLVAMLFTAGVRRAWIAGMIAGGALLLPALWFSGFLHDYQRSRVDVFLHQSSMSEEMKRGEGYQLYHAKLALGGGGLGGHGFANGPENRGGTLPARHSDAIFVVLAEEWGFLGALVPLLLYAALFGLLADHAIRIREPVGRLLIAGTLALLGSEVLVNLGMCTGLLPIVGLTLPFVSSGGSSLLASGLILGIAMNAAARREFVFAS